MQLTPRYLVNNSTKLIANVAGFITEYRPVYSKQIQVYKGIDNVLDFRTYNADQRPINITTYTPKFVAFDENNNMVIEKDGTMLDDGGTAKRGKFSVTITENELLNIKQQFLNYNIYLQETDGDKVLTYSHSNFDNDSTIYVNARTFPGPAATHSVSSFQQEGVELMYGIVAQSMHSLVSMETKHYTLQQRIQAHTAAILLYRLH